ncbi:MAG: rRNA pseudouridine synthase [Proteobacteria bacterium]|nr:rRNA pseudouridine synthase [Pseudomonadota bacterium]
MRLQKFLSHAGACSRRTGEEWIAAGRVSVNNEVITTPGFSVDPETDRVEVDGKLLTIVPERVTIALNKPQGYVTSCSQPQEKIVLELVDLGRRLYPVGRLDKDSTGLILLTDNGELHHRLSHPSFDHEKEYVVETRYDLADRDLERLARPMEVLGKQTRPARVQRISRRKFSLVLQEGMNRQIRRMLGNVGHDVASLQRVRIAHIHIGDLALGAWRILSEKEVQKLLEGGGPKTSSGRSRSGGPADRGGEGRPEKKPSRERK